ncbi:ABC transporter ATP-binding protein [Advenella sp. RU8]|uniref:ABC transporter ATP-binding protein n=1 Tax=Advenella sp. RU8 TaxID=3399575 RepID=UPI003AAA3346
MSVNTTSRQQGIQLAFQNIYRRFGSAVTIHVDQLTIEPGSLTVLLGRSGCGKTTLLNLAAGLDHADSGQVLHDGLGLSGPAAQSAFIFQHNNLFPWMTAAENISFALENHGVAASEARQIAGELLSQVGLGDLHDRLPGQLSGGMRQRVVLARSMALKPRLMLLDEPFSALDNQTRRLMQQYLLQAWHLTNATVLMVTHDLSEALMLANRIVLMASQPQGHIAEIIDIDMPHPRDPDAPAFRILQKRLDSFLEHEMRIVERT